LGQENKGNFTSRPMYIYLFRICCSDIRILHVR